MRLCVSRISFVIHFIFITQKRLSILDRLYLRVEMSKKVTNKTVWTFI